MSDSLSSTDNHLEFGLKIIRDKIRFGHEPDNPTLIPLWLNQESVLCPNIHEPIELHRDHYEKQFRLLLETIVDELVPSHWRQLCLNHIYQPLGALKRIADDKQSEQDLQRLVHELSITSHYVATSLCKI